MAFTVSPPQPCRRARGRWACRGRGPSCAPHGRSGVARGQRRRRKSRGVACLFSWALFNQTWSVAGIVIHRPGIGKRTVELLKVRPAAHEPTENVEARHVMTALTNPSSDAAERKVG